MSSKLFEINSVTEYNQVMGFETLHPLITVVDFSKFNPSEASKEKARQYGKVRLNVYAIFLKDLKCGNITYGVNTYDYEEGSLIFMSPGQVFGVTMKEEKEREEEKSPGKAILFHPDLLKDTDLERHMDGYSFFSYEVNEALHLSARERVIIEECFTNINYELSRPIDAHTKTLLISYLELFLNHSKRFYERQFHTRSHVNTSILSRFEKILRDYFAAERPLEEGLPSVNYCADKLFLSPNYLGDLLKRETGKSAQEHIQLKLIAVAKKKMADSEKNISQIAYELGFKHPQHFTRMFKRSLGFSPSEYRNLN